MKDKTITIEDSIYPALLKQIKNPPQTLYAMGNIELLTSDCVAIVGSRVCSNYGEKMAEKFSYELAKKDITVVSGMALGIDTKAHMGALKANAKTIAVLRQWL